MLSAMADGSKTGEIRPNLPSRRRLGADEGRRMLMSGASSRLFWRFQVEQPLDCGRHLFLLQLLRRLLEFAGQRTSDLTSNACCKLPEQCILVLGKRPALTLEGLQFLPAYLVKTGAQRHNGWYHALGQKLAPKTQRFLFDNLLCHER